MGKEFLFWVIEKLGTSQWWWLYNIVNITNATELCTFKTFKWQNLCYTMYLIDQVPSLFMTYLNEGLASFLLPCCS